MDSSLIFMASAMALLMAAEASRSLGGIVWRLSRICRGGTWPGVLKRTVYWFLEVQSQAQDCSDYLVIVMVNCVSFVVVSTIV